MNIFHFDYEKLQKKKTEGAYNRTCADIILKQSI